MLTNLPALGGHRWYIRLEIGDLKRMLAAFVTRPDHSRCCCPQDVHESDTREDTRHMAEAHT